MASAEKAFNPVLAEILRTEQVTSVSGERLPLRNHITPEEGRFLQELIWETGATQTLEVGLAYGISAMFVCDALRQSTGAHHILIDPHQNARWQGIGLKNLREAGYGAMIEFHERPSHQALPPLELRGVRVDFAFIDGWHTFDHTLVDFFFVDRMLRVGGVVAIDDAQEASVRKACRYIVTNRSYRVLRCLGPQRRLRPRTFRPILRAAVAHSHTLRRLVRPDLVTPETDLELFPDSRCIALVKEGEDNRKTLGYVPF